MNEKQFAMTILVGMIACIVVGILLCFIASNQSVFNLGAWVVIIGLFLSTWWTYVFELFRWR